MKSTNRYTISFLRSGSVDKVFRILLNDGFIRENVDLFFLDTSNYCLLSRYISEKKAIAYFLQDPSSKKYLGVFLAFRFENCLYGHFLFRKHHGANTLLTISEMIRRMRQYLKRKGIFITAFIGQIPEKNKAAVWVSRKLGAKYMRCFYSGNHEKIVEYVLFFTDRKSYVLSPVIPTLPLP